MTPEELYAYVETTDRADGIETLRRHMIPEDARERIARALHEQGVRGLSILPNWNHRLADAVLAALKEGT